MSAQKQRGHKANSAARKMQLFINCNSLPYMEILEIIIIGKFVPDRSAKREPHSEMREMVRQIFIKWTP